MRRGSVRTVIAVLACASALAAAQAPATALPANYKTIYEDADFLVMRVYYGPHEFVAMHDHSAFPTVYVYLDDSGEVEIRHEGAEGEVVKRPPTHTGAFRIAPGVKERHSVQNLSDLPSDFLRIELKRISPMDIQKVFRGDAPPQPFLPGTTTAFEDAALKLQRVQCGMKEACELPALPDRSLLVALTPMSFVEPKGVRSPIQAGDVLTLPAGTAGRVLTTPGARCLRLSLLFPDASAARP